MLSNEIKVFGHADFGQIRTAGTSDNSLFCLADLCKAVGLKNPSSVRQRLDNEDVQLVDFHALNSTEGVIIGNSTANFVTESGFYDVLLQSSSPNVRKFRKWITSEVLPSIRKTGGYIASNAQDTPEEIMARALLIAQSTIEKNKQRMMQLEGENAEQRKQLADASEKVRYVNDVLASPNTYTVQQVAKELDMTVNKLYGRLKDMGVFFKQSGMWMLSHKYNGKGYTKTRTHTFTRSDGSTGTSSYTVLTETGRQFVHTILK